MALNVSAYFASGSYEVTWSLYLTSLGAGPAAIGLTFFSFALPVLLVSGWFGKFADRRGGFWQIVIGLLVASVCGVLYVIVPQVWWVVVVGLVEGAAFAAASPALYLLIARSAPAGKASTAQGIFGAAGTLGTIIASLFSGYAAAVDLRIPFVATTVAMLGALLDRARRRRTAAVHGAAAACIACFTGSLPASPTRRLPAGRRSRERRGPHLGRGDPSG